MTLEFTGERIVPGAENCEPLFADKMYMEHSARYKLASKFAKGAKILDIGCGVGYGSAILADSDAQSVTAFDLSAEAIEHARAFYARPTISFETGDATAFSYEDKFDLIVCFELIEHVPDPDKTFECIMSCLAQDGVLVMSTPRALEEKRNDFHIHEFAADEFENKFRSLFRNARFFQQNNYMGSIIAYQRPDVLVEPSFMHPAFDLDAADYIIGVATNGAAETIASIENITVLNNEDYVKLLERDVDILQRRRTDLEAQVKQEEGSIAEMKSQIAQKEQSMAEMKAKFALRPTETALMQDIARLSERVQEMRSSFSWKVTSPLREVNRFFLRTFSARYRKERRARKAPHAYLSGPHSPDAKLSIPSKSWVEAGPGPDIVYVIGCWPGESKRYRVFNAVEALASRGYRVEVLREEHMGRIEKDGWCPAAIVFFRTPESHLTAACISYARKHSIKTFFDIDDLVFEPDLVDQIDGFQLLPESERATYIEGVRRYRAFLLETDAVIGSTKPLVAALAALGKPAYLVPNTFNRIQSEKAEVLRQERKDTRDSLRIGYFSGSRTHNQDFAVAAPAILRLLGEFPSLRLLIVGELDLPSGFDSLSGQVERLDFMPYQKMQEELARCDINIAPLVIGNPFNEAKSELKWFEAALLDVPCVVSKTAPYENAVVDRATGMLAANEAEWYEKLRMLLQDATLRQRIGENARQAALSNWGQDSLGARLLDVLPLKDVSPSSQPVSANKDRKKIDWIIPGLILGGGGHRNILRAAYFLEQFGHDVGLIFTGVEESAEEVRALLHKHFYPFQGQIKIYDGIFRYSDVLFATHWSTVYTALEARGMTGEIMYFIQDFEPMFAPMGTEYILAENTYRKGLYGISSGPWCAHVLRKDFNAEVDFFEFPIDKSVYFPRQRQKTEKNIIFFAKPDMPRRCYELGVAMLSEFHRLMPDVEIIFYGARNIDERQLDFPITQKGLMPTIHDLAQAYSDADLGVVFSTTNPSLVPYEMMACGTPVVDLDRAGNEVNYDGRNDIALLADPEPKVMARQMATLLKNADELSSRSKNGLELTARMPDELGMAKRVEELILNRLRQGVQKVA
ncbi:glycosyltransferase [Agrobacterium tumefaciens]|uniref:rhamnosyltransferase WsaF family glycosyltransferase n=2 Tax=Agrobacterium tumefaciens TaxID=358 RepID=UPI00054E3CF2|nr:glycosyltransferase [Agrobacterium tumefaciens]